MTIQEAARYVGTNPGQVIKAANAGTIGTMTDGVGWSFTQAELDTWKASDSFPKLGVSG